MPTRSRFLAAALFSVLVSLGLARVAEATIRGSFRASFEAASTLHDFSGEAAPVAFEVEENAGRVAGREAWNVVLAVDVASLSTGLALRDAKMRTMFEAERHPEIVATVGAVPVERLASGAAFPFDLRIREVTRHVSGRVARWQASARAASFDVEFDVSLADFALEPPRALFVTVADRVHVVVTVEARLEPAVARR